METTTKQLNEDILKVINEVKELPLIDPLKLLFMRIKDKAVTDSDMMNYNITQIYQSAKIYKVKNGEIWTCEIKGEVRTGKSTVGFKETKDLNRLRYVLKRKPQGELAVKMGEVICADQTEFVRVVHRRPRQMCLLIDEYNAMAEGGANSTTESQQIEAYNTMFASDYVDRINCNPVRAMDSNATIQLQIMGKLTADELDKQGNLVSSKLTGKTRVLVIYCDRLNNDFQALGYADIYVWDVIENWEKNVRAIFEKKEKTKEDEIFIEKQAKTDEYVAYQLKKERRQKLMTEHHIRDIRDLEYSKVGLSAFRTLNKNGKAEKRTTRIPQELIIEEIKDTCEDEGMIYSFYAESIVVNKLKGLLSLAFEIGKANRTLAKKNMSADDKDGALDNRQYANKKLVEKLNREARKCALYDEFLNIQ